MSRTDKDRPYSVRCFDLSDNKPRYTSHMCGCHFYRQALQFRDNGHLECDLGEYSIRDVRNTWATHAWWSVRIPGCEYVLIEDRNDPSQRSYKRRLKRIVRRKQRQWNCRARFDPECDDLQLNSFYTGAYAHKN